MKVFAEGPWNRPARIILAIDIETTLSSVAFAHLYPGGPQSLHRVHAWPGQEHHKGKSEVPTVVYYDVHDNAVAFGAEALNPEVEERAEDEQWQAARHFRLHLHPESMQREHCLSMGCKSLPTGVSLLKIYTDFIAYLVRHTKDFFQSRVINGRQIWNDLHKDMLIVFPHPNTWGIREQDFLRKAAIAAKLVSSEKAISHIAFVTEAEASVHFHMFHGDLHNRLAPDITFLVCDAGESTINTIVYSVKSTSPVLKIEEEKAPACVRAGGVFVATEFEKYLTSILNQLDQLDHEEHIDYVKKGVEDFKGTAMKTFETVDSEHRIDIGAGRLTRPELRIRRGTLILDGATIETFLQPSVTQAVSLIRQQMSGLRCQHILLVGQFSESLYLRKTLLSEFGNACGVNVANDSVSKAVADGAVIWCAKLFGSAPGRSTRMSYGVEINDTYDPKNADHLGRTVYRHAAGYNFVVGKWSEIIGKGVVVGAEETVRHSYWRSYTTAAPCLSTFTVTIFSRAYNNSNDWLRDEYGRINKGFEKVCEVEANLTGMHQALIKKTCRDGDYWYLNFTVLFLFGGAELRAFVEWEENGNTHTSPASILPESCTNA